MTSLLGVIVMLLILFLAVLPSAWLIRKISREQEAERERMRIEGADYLPPGERAKRRGLYG